MNVSQVLVSIPCSCDICTKGDRLVKNLTDTTSMPVQSVPGRAPARVLPRGPVRLVPRVQPGLSGTV